LKISDHFAAGSDHAEAFSHDSPGSDPESESGASETDAATSRADEPNGSDEPAAKSGLVEALLLFVEEVAASGKSVIEVYKDRMRLALRRSLVRLAIGVGAAVCAICWLGAAALACLRGVCGGFTALFDGRTWLGELVGGLFSLTLAAIAVAFYLRLSSRRELTRLKAKYERIRNEHKNEQASAGGAGDGGGVARSGGGSGDRTDRGLGAALG
jgi:uncharacterized membrane protein YgcG